MTEILFGLQTSDKLLVYPPKQHAGCNRCLVPAAGLILFLSVDDVVFASIDNSEYSRNGDFTPTRLASQKDACNLVCGTKLRSNAEATVALLAMGGK